MKKIVVLILIQVCSTFLHAQDLIIPQTNITTDNYKLAKKYYDKASLKLNSGDYNGAISEYKEALILYPNYLEANNDIGVAYLKLDDFAIAHSYFDIVLKINPDYELSRKNKAVVFYSQATKELNTNDYEAAIADYIEALILNPEYFEAYNDIGFAYLNKEDYTIAHSYFDIALKMNPGYELSCKRLIMFTLISSPFLQTGTSETSSFFIKILRLNFKP